MRDGGEGEVVKERRLVENWEGKEKMDRKGRRRDRRRRYSKMVEEKLGVGEGEEGPGCGRRVAVLLSSLSRCLREGGEWGGEANREFKTIHGCGLYSDWYILRLVEAVVLNKHATMNPIIIFFQSLVLPSSSLISSLFFKVALLSTTTYYHYH